MSYYWVTAQSEYSTDILFKSPDHLEELFPRLLRLVLGPNPNGILDLLRCARGEPLRCQFLFNVLAEITDRLMDKNPETYGQG